MAGKSPQNADEILAETKALLNAKFADLLRGIILPHRLSPQRAWRSGAATQNSPQYKENIEYRISNIEYRTGKSQSEARALAWRNRKNPPQSFMSPGDTLNHEKEDA